MFETNDNPSIDDFTHDAFAILGEGGAMRLSDKHTCSECTQECKAVADFLPAPNDAAAVLGVEENQDGTRPDYICIDKACLVLRTSIQNGSWEEWCKTSRLIVDAYHYINHCTTDMICQKYCNPAPLDGSAPNLVVEAETKDGEKYLKRGFNTQACKQLSGWIGAFDSILKRMTVDNFNWFLHAMLFYHT
ncbi:uncharacterized protein LACBIDRAFT_308467 [Laccaria bicolor S238N-H82]|nr:uncharacterized protein LACBIDRAFT_308467 [Laccaria bicolor S238N-H82]EDR13485.1 predicted protein [Laccaria bicolor S238N-H82]|eukprot:XP_001875983.1 predicted protein [Laccaria bicolor S238N-H82]